MDRERNERQQAGGEEAASWGCTRIGRGGTGRGNVALRERQRWWKICGGTCAKGWRTVRKRREGESPRIGKNGVAKNVGNDEGRKKKLEIRENRRGEKVNVARRFGRDWSRK